MSLPDATPPRKRLRLGLWLPFVALGVLIAGWSAAWVWAKGQTAQRMDAAVAALAKAGYQVSWKERRIGGYPFRMDITLTEPRVRDPSGWGLQAPRLEAEAYMHAITSWIAAAPEGIAFVRPVGGPVAVKGELIRASLTHPNAHPPSFSFEGVKLTFAPEPGAQPFGLASAGRVEFHLRAGPDDEGGVFVRVDDGKAAPASLLGRMAGAKPVAVVWNATLSKMSAFAGSAWPDAVRHWSDAGGRMTVRQAGVTAGDAGIGVNSGSLAAGPDGRLAGALEVTLRQAPSGLAALADLGLTPPEAAQAAALVVQAREGVANGGAANGGAAVQATITFQAGRTTLGPVALGAAPKVYNAPVLP
jgi:hypothetical protein